jgi:hypothetical protein
MILLRDYQGVSVRLTVERRAHILGHPEMAGLEAALGETLLTPERVIESLSDPSAALHYRFFVGTQVGDKWLCVVVKYTALDAFVLTAYLTDKIKKGTQLWPNP